MEINIQTMETLELEQRGNVLEKVIPRMWRKKGRDKIELDRTPSELHSALGLGFGKLLGPGHFEIGLKGSYLAMSGTNSFFTLFKTWLSGELVGDDDYGNRYYREKKPVPGRRERRWVVFSKEVEPTRVPPGWVGWLHSRIKEPPSEAPLPSPQYEKEPSPNPTGTSEAYLPDGAVQRGGTRAPSTGDYEAWRPE